MTSTLRSSTTLTEIFEKNFEPEVHELMSIFEPVISELEKLRDPNAVWPKPLAKDRDSKKSTSALRESIDLALRIAEHIAPSIKTKLIEYVRENRITLNQLEIEDDFEIRHYREKIQEREKKLQQRREENPNFLDKVSLLLEESGTKHRFLSSRINRMIQNQNDKDFLLGRYKEKLKENEAKAKPSGSCYFPDKRIINIDQWTNSDDLYNILDTTRHLIHEAEHTHDTPYTPETGIYSLVMREAAAILPDTATATFMQQNFPAFDAEKLESIRLKYYLFASKNFMDCFRLLDEYVKTGNLSKEKVDILIKEDKANDGNRKKCPSRVIYKSLSKTFHIIGEVVTRVVFPNIKNKETMERVLDILRDPTLPALGKLRKLGVTQEAAMEAFAPILQQLKAQRQSQPSAEK